MYSTFGSSRLPVMSVVSSSSRSGPLRLAVFAPAAPLAAAAGACDAAAPCDGAAAPRAPSDPGEATAECAGPEAGVVTPLAARSAAGPGVAPLGAVPAPVSGAGGAAGAARVELLTPGSS